MVLALAAPALAGGRRAVNTGGGSEIGTLTRIVSQAADAQLDVSNKLGGLDSAYAKHSAQSSFARARQDDGDSIVGGLRAVQEDVNNAIGCAGTSASIDKSCLDVAQVAEDLQTIAKAMDGLAGKLTHPPLNGLPTDQDDDGNPCSGATPPCAQHFSAQVAALQRMEEAARQRLAADALALATAPHLRAGSNDTNISHSCAGVACQPGKVCALVPPNPGAPPADYVPSCQDKCPAGQTPDSNHVCGGAPPTEQDCNRQGKVLDPATGKCVPPDACHPNTCPTGSNGVQQQCSTSALGTQVCSDAPAAPSCTGCTPTSFVQCGQPTPGKDSCGQTCTVPAKPCGSSGVCHQDTCDAAAPACGRMTVGHMDCGKPCQRYGNACSTFDCDDPADRLCPGVGCWPKAEDCPKIGPSRGVGRGGPPACASPLVWCKALTPPHCAEPSVCENAGTPQPPPPAKGTCPGGDLESCLNGCGIDNTKCKMNCDDLCN